MLTRYFRYAETKNHPGWGRGNITKHRRAGAPRLRVWRHAYVSPRGDGQDPVAAA